MATQEREGLTSLVSQVRPSLFPRHSSLGSGMEDVVSRRQGVQGLGFKGVRV